MLNLIFALFFGLTVGNAMAGPAHVHGQAELALALDADLMTLTLESPLENLLGFERAPRNEAERQRVRAMADSLRDADRLFRPDNAAQCKLQSVSLRSDLLAPELLGESAPNKADGKAGSPPAGEAGHGELEAEFVFRCRQMSSLRGVDLGLFAAFPKLKRLSVVIVTRSGQSAQRLTPKTSRLQLAP